MSLSPLPLLRIVRGKSQYPLRSIDREAFLIGAGSNCQIQLSAGEIPMNCAVLRPQGAECLIESLHSEPAMYVNGSRLRSARLQSGDRVVIGPYEFEFLAQQISEEPACIPLHASSPVIAERPFPLLVPQVPPNLSALSAEELVDRIERELELLELLGEFDDPPLEFYEADEVPRKSA